LLICLELTDRRGDVRRREDRRRHLIEQRLKYVVVAAVDQEDLGIGMPQRMRRRDPGEAAADDDDALAFRRWRVNGCCCLLRPIIHQNRAHDNESPRSCYLLCRSENCWRSSAHRYWAAILPATAALRCLAMHQRLDARRLDAVSGHEGADSGIGERLAEAERQTIRDGDALRMVAGGSKLLVLRRHGLFPWCAAGSGHLAPGNRGRPCQAPE
jgi:hypothetical protein